VLLRRLLFLSIAVISGFTIVDYLWANFLRDDPATWAMPLQEDTSASQAFLPVELEPAFTNTLYLPMVNKYSMPGYVYPFGIVMYGDVDDNAGLAKMQQAGSGWVTTFVLWSDIEPNAPVSGTHTYDWSKYDTKFGNAKAAGMQVYVAFGGNPSWAAPSAWGVLPPSSLPDLANVVAATVERYDGDGFQDAPGGLVVNNWSFYAEEDTQQYWGHQGAEFAQMMATVSPAVHNAHPEARVLIGGIGYDWFTDDEYHNPPGPFVRRFITDTLGTLNTSYGGARQYIDAFDFHFYLVTAQRFPTIRDKALEIKQIMSNHGVGDLPLLVSEMAYWSDTPTMGSSQTRQAQYLVHFYVGGLSMGIEQLSWWTVFDAGRPELTDGLFEGQDLSKPKQSYLAYQTMTRELGYARFTSVLNAAGAEGYVFMMADGTQKTVVWGTSPTPTQMSFAQACARQVEMLGSSSQIVDGGAGDLDGAANGQVRVQVSQDQPIYVGACN